MLTGVTENRVATVSTLTKASSGRLLKSVVIGCSELMEPPSSHTGGPLAFSNRMKPTETGFLRLGVCPGSGPVFLDPLAHKRLAGVLTLPPEPFQQMPDQIGGRLVRRAGFGV